MVPCLYWFKGGLLRLRRQVDRVRIVWLQVDLEELETVGIPGYELDLVTIRRVADDRRVKRINQYSNL